MRECSNVVGAFRDNVSESEGEEVAGEREVVLPQDLPGRGNLKSEQSAIRLTEVGVACVGGCGQCH